LKQLFINILIVKKATLKKEVPRINQVLAALVKKQESQVFVANELGISSQSLGYYMRGRKIPVTVLEKWKERYNQDLMELARSGFETIVSRETEKQRFDNELKQDAITLELWEQVQKDTSNKDKEIDRLWKLIDRLDLPGDAIKRVPSENS
jgi:predicted transcriptional regulator